MYQNHKDLLQYNDNFNHYMVHQKGIAAEKYEEFYMEATNHRIYPDITTVMLFTPSPVADISSSTVREVLSFGRTVEEFMPIGIDINKYL